MQKWDYAILNIVKSYGMNYRVNGDKQGQWKDKPIHLVMREMGRAGFELVVYDGDNYIFKRPMPNRSSQNSPDDADDAKDEAKED